MLITAAHPIGADTSESRTLGHNTYMHAAYAYARIERAGCAGCARTSCSHVCGTRVHCMRAHQNVSE